MNDLLSAARAVKDAYVDDASPQPDAFWYALGVMFVRCELPAAPAVESLTVERLAEAWSQAEVKEARHAGVPADITDRWTPDRYLARAAAILAALTETEPRP